MTTPSAIDQDRTRVRQRLGNDASEQARLFKSELETYWDYFSTKERRQLQAAIAALNKLIDIE